MTADHSPPLSLPFVAVVPVGPGERELRRLADLTAGLMRHEGTNLGRLLLVDDVAAPRDFGALVPGLPMDCVQVLHNPRRGRGNPWFGGMAANTVCGLAAAAASGDYAYVLKLDTDSLVIAPFHERLSRFFVADAACGVAGSCYAVDTHGQPVPPSTWAVNLAKWQRPLRLRRHPFPHPEQGLVGVNGRIRRIIAAALAAGTPLGYRPGHCAQGGGYAVRRELLDDLRARGWLEGDWWPRTDLGEDVVVSLLATAAGWRVRDSNQAGEVFGVQFRGLPFPPEELCARGYGIVHSVKCADEADEAVLRARFRAASAAA